MRVFIYSEEGLYGGHHGINFLGVYDVKNIENAYDIGYDSGVDLIEEYSLEEDYYDELGNPCTEIEIYCEVYSIKDEVELSLETLNELCYELGKELFIKEYCYSTILKEGN